MKCVLSILSHLTLLATIFTFLFPTEITSCSDNTYDIITMMHQDPNYQQDPCYIKWKADQDAKLDELFKLRDRLEKITTENNRISSENRVREYQDRYNSYPTPKMEKNKNVWIFVGIFVSIIFAMCFYVVWSSVRKSIQDSPSAIVTTNNLQTDSNPGRFIPISTITSNPGGNQTTSDSSINANNNANLIAPGTEARESNSEQRTQVTSLQQPQNNLPLLPRGGITRENSLPSYDDAVGMSSEPPHYSERL